MSAEKIDGHPCASCLRWPECNGVEWPRCQDPEGLILQESIIRKINMGVMTINQARELLGLEKI